MTRERETKYFFLVTDVIPLKVWSFIKMNKIQNSAEVGPSEYSFILNPSPAAHSVSHPRCPRCSPCCPRSCPPSPSPWSICLPFLILVVLIASLLWGRPVHWFPSQAVLVPPTQTLDVYLLSQAMHFQSDQSWNRSVSTLLKPLFPSEWNWSCFFVFQENIKVQFKFLTWGAFFFQNTKPRIFFKI